MISRKPRRLARSQIPTKPVEMPAGIESLDVQVCFYLAMCQYTPLTHCMPLPGIVVLFSALAFVQFGELGIDFVGLEPQTPPPPEQVPDGSLSSLTVSVSAAAGDQLTTVDTPTQLTYSQLQQRYVTVSACTCRA